MASPVARAQNLDTWIGDVHIPGMNLQEPVAQALVNQALIRYEGPRHAAIQEGLERERAHGFLATCRAIFSAHRVPEEICWLAQLESLWKSEILSSSGALGYWQFLRAVGLEYGLGFLRGIDQRTQFEPSTNAAAKLLTHNYAQFGDWPLAIAAYNMGGGALEYAIERGHTRDYWELVRKGVLSTETAAYVPRFVANLLIGSHPAQYGFR